MERAIFEELPSETREYKKDAIKAATELNYSSEVIYKLDRAKTVDEIARIMTTAREKEDFEANEIEALKNKSQYRYLR